MILAEKDSTMWSEWGKIIISMWFFKFSFSFLDAQIFAHMLTNIHATLPIRICASFHSNTHTDTLFPSLTPNNYVVTSQIYSITATNPLTPPFFLLHLSILFILPLTSEHLAYTQEHFLGFQCDASHCILNYFYFFTCLLFLNVKLG